LRKKILAVPIVVTFVLAATILLAGAAQQPAATSAAVAVAHDTAKAAVSNIPS
jgi:hypothetical protein